MKQESQVVWTRLPKELYDYLKKRSKEEGRTLCGIIRTILLKEKGE